MMLLWELFRTFFVVGLLSFGGGYAMIPVIGHQVEVLGWISPQEYNDIIAIAGMSPGPIAANSAIIVGYQMDGVAGAAVAALGITLPSLIIILAATAFFMKMYQHRVVKAAFYGLKPVVTGLILFGAVRYAMNNGMVTDHWDSALALPILVFTASLLALIRFKIHPFRLILLAGLVGMAVYG